MKVDLHAHYWPAPYLDLMEEWQRPQVALARGMAAGAAPSEVAERLATLDLAGIERQIVSVTAQMPANADRRRAVTAARLANDLCAELVAARPDRFGAFAVMPLPHVAEAVAETDRALDELKLCGVAVTTTMLGRAMSDSDFAEFYANLERRAAVLFVHPAGTVRGVAPGGADLTWLAGAPFEGTCAALDWFLSGHPKRFPNVRVVFTHLGGLLPMVWRRIENALPSGPPDNVWFDNRSHGHTAALRCAVDTFGAARVVLGTDYPFLRGPDLLRCITYVEQSGLERADVQAILELNAATALGGS